MSYLLKDIAFYGSCVVGYVSIGVFGTGIVNKLRVFSQVKLHDDGWIVGIIAWPIATVVVILYAPFRFGLGNVLEKYIQWSDRPIKKQRKETISA